MADVVFEHYKYHDSLNKEEFKSIFESCIQIGNFKNRAGGFDKWICDTRSGFANSNALQIAADFFVDVLDNANIDQIIVKGFGAYQFLGAVLVSSHHTIQGSIIRDSAKTQGKENLIEGKYEIGKPILLIDDVLNSGKSSLEAIKVLRQTGWKLKDIHCSFLIDFQWGGGTLNLNKHGVMNDNISYGLQLNNN